MWATRMNMFAVGCGSGPITYDHWHGEIPKSFVYASYLSAEATQEMVERKYEDEMAALQPCTENSNKQKGGNRNEAAWEILFAHDQDLRDAIAAATEWSVEQLPAKLDQLRMRLANPLYTKSLALIQESKVAVQVLQLKDVTDERDVAALQCLCERLWCVMYHEMSVETYDRFARALKRTAVGGGVLT